MTSKAQAIVEAALALPEADRVQIVEQLLETLSTGTEELTDDELAAELDRRRAEIDSGAVKPVAWSEIQFPQ